LRNLTTFGWCVALFGVLFWSRRFADLALFAPSPAQRRAGEGGLILKSTKRCVTLSGVRRRVNHTVAASPAAAHGRTLRIVTLIRDKH
jgi:hypothetical protein